AGRRSRCGRDGRTGRAWWIPCADATSRCGARVSAEGANRASEGHMTFGHRILGARVGRCAMEGEPTVAETAPRLLPWVASILYLAVLASGLYFALAGLCVEPPLRTAGFVAVLGL